MCAEYPCKMIDTNNLMVLRLLTEPAKGGASFSYQEMVETSSHACVCVSLLAQSCLTLCDPMDCSSPGSSVYGILQVIILEWVAMSPSRESSQPRDQTQTLSVAGRFSLPSEPPGKPSHAYAVPVNDLMKGLLVCTTQGQPPKAVSQISYTKKKNNKNSFSQIIPRQLC